MSAGNSDGSGEATPYVGIDASPALGRSTSVEVGVTTGRPFGFWNHTLAPSHQIATQSPCRPATANCCPVLALSPQSAAQVVPAVPAGSFGCRPGSSNSGASALGAVRSQ